MHPRTITPMKAVLLGLLSLVPFLILNTVAMNQFEPVLSLLRPEGSTTILEQIIMFLFVLPLPLLGAYVALTPVLRKGADGVRVLHPLNVIVALLIIVASLAISFELGMEIYECDVLGVVNCD